MTPRSQNSAEFFQSPLPNSDRPRFAGGVAIAVAVILANCTPSVWSQTRKEEAPANPIEQRIEVLREKLKLTDEQVSKVRDIFKESAPELKKLREDTSIPNEQKREKMREWFRSHTEKMGPFLTAEQKKALAAVRDSSPRNGERSTELPGFLRLEALKERLKLTEEQSTKIGPILKAELEKLRSLRSSAESDQLRDKAREVMQQIRERISAELTTEQKQELSEWVAQIRAPKNRPAEKSEKSDK
jgi:protein CpxP